ncbi:MAG: flagellar motor protein MotD [Candidatus Competibacteraceae bacterium]|nr:flagellar motor protein MotD [Candidatus Competibacteraceae bacterium]MBK7985186.1 flagellar motor protein MotD [Candidatus Competibacteraceae bacterium]MBK8895739.1 flagellar motor protein MotD [Candidatus Competibacteraceae bacterium]MBK8962831.1 flagellar motor protein MotD [Candidatus Competibacteraceae bacterium]MBK9953236.1 flagellar motor protein MotD [Candidatus Competibacteraceae bacterium]
MSRKKHAEAHENHERWLVSYADFITLLFAFFVVMYSVSSVNEGKFRVLSESMMAAFRSTTPNSMKPIQLGGMVGTPSPQSVGQPNMSPSVAPDLRPLPAAVIQRPQRAVAKKAGPAQNFTVAAGKSEGDPNLAKVAAKLKSYLSELVRTDMANIRSSEFWVEVEIKNSILFASGSAIANPEALPSLALIAEVLREIPNRIQVEGFTDNRPISTPAYPSNWELSAARAANVVSVMMKNGVRPERMSAIGYGEYQPIADNRTEQGRLQNRRVVLVIMGNTDTRYPAEPEQVTAAPTATVAENSGTTGKASAKIH